MIKRRIALASVVAVVVGLGAAPIAGADNSGPPKPSFNSNNNSFVCHGYPGATVENNNGVHGTPNGGNCLA